MLISASELVKQSYFLYKKNLEVFFSYAMLVIAPPMILKILAVIIYAVFDLRSDPFVDTMYGYVFIIFSIIGFVISLWFSAAMIKVVSERLDNKNYGNFKVELIFAKHKLLIVITTSILSTLAVFAGILLFIVPGIIFSVWLAFSMFAVVLDDKKDADALKFSKSLVEGRWWNVLFLLMIPTVIFIVISGVIQIPLDQIMKNTSSLTINTAMFAIGSVTNALIIPFLISAQTILYTELKKTRKLA